MEVHIDVSISILGCVISVESYCSAVIIEGTDCCGYLMVFGLFLDIGHSAVMFEFVRLIWSPLSICVYMLLVRSGSTYESSGWSLTIKILSNSLSLACSHDVNFGI
jgi:hypothetical protein